MTRAGRVRIMALAAVVLSLCTGTMPNTPSRASTAPLVAGSDFTITSTISSSSTSADQPALLYPGVRRYLWYTVHNPMPEPITITSLGIEHIDAPESCSTVNLDLGDPTFRGALVLPARTAIRVRAPSPISLIDRPTVNQDACQDVNFNFTFTGTGRYAGNPSRPGKVLTETLVSATPSLVLMGSVVRVTAQVLPLSSSGGAASGPPAGVPTGTVTFHLTDPSGRESLLGMGTLGPDGSVSLSPALLPAGASTLQAVYAGTDAFAASTSPDATLSIIAPPAQCTGSYTTSILGTPDSPVITGTSGNDFIQAVGADYQIKAGKGDDCLVVGDGNNVVSDGSGADVVIAGSGSNRITVVGSGNVVVVGDGDGNRVIVKGTKKGKKVRTANRNRVTLGDGARNRVTVGKGSKNVIALGDGARNRVGLKGSKNRVRVGNGDANRVTLGKGSKNRVTIGAGARNRITIRGTKNRVVLGRGKKNRVLVRTGTRARTTCSLPTPPRSWRWTPARYYQDTFTRCRVVTR